MRVHHLPYVILLATSALTSPALSAQNVSVRTGEHGEYSRVVFEWSSAVSYTLEKRASSLGIRFNQAATPDIKKSDLRAIKKMDVVSTDPLHVTLNIIEGSRIKDIQTGSRVIIDIYPPAASDLKTKPPEVSTPKAVEKKAQDINTQQAEEKKAEQTPPPEAAPPKTLPVAAVMPSEKTAEPTKALETPAAPVSKSVFEGNSVVSLTSTQNYGVAAVRHRGQLFIVNDKSDLLLKPQLSGVLQRKGAQAEDVESDQGKVRRLDVGPGGLLSGEGGGLIWQIAISDKSGKNSPIEPVRENKDKGAERGGKIIWPFQSARNIIAFKDPAGGQKIFAVTVDDAEKFSGPGRSFVEFDVLESAVGLAILPKVDDLEVKIVKGNVEITRPGGLTLMDQGFVGVQQQTETPPTPLTAENAQRIYDFKNWQLGGLHAVQENRNVLLGGLKEMSPGARAESLLTLGKMYLSNGLGSEAMGVLRFAAQELPALEQGPEFKALRGAALVLNHDNEEAFTDLSDAALKPFEEVNYWRAAAAADLGDWQQAGEIMPQKAGVLADYPPELQNRLGLVLTEIALRGGKVDLAAEFLKILEKNDKLLRPPQKAAMSYLLGEAARQQGKAEITEKLWKPLTKGPDDLYRAKAGLALTRLQVDNKKLTPGKAIDALERLRYSWRGDQLEAQINSWLGRTYFESGEYIKGLRTMRDAASFVPETQQAKKIAADMSDLFTELFVGPELEKVPPTDAVAVYNQFNELLPPGERGDLVTQKLSEHLAKSDLLSRAGDLLNSQAKTLQGEKAYRVAERLAAIRLLDGEPDKAIAALNLADQKFSELPEEMRTASRKQKLDLLRARALSRQGHPDKAIELLNNMTMTPDVNALRADIAWKAGYWDDAAEALGDVIIDQNISMTRPLTEVQTSLMLQRAIALNLASDRIALADLREKYSDLMNQTEKAKVFEVITRPRQSGTLADRDTLMGSVKEVDLFAEFLNSYKTMKDSTENSAPAKADEQPASGEKAGG